jgi:hypothetical protein
MDDNELPKKISWTNPGGQRGRGRPKWIDGVEGNWVVEIGGRMSRIEVDDICWRRPRTTEDCRADGDDDNDDDNDDDGDDDDQKQGISFFRFHITLTSYDLRPASFTVGAGCCFHGNNVTGA